MKNLFLVVGVSILIGVGTGLIFQEYEYFMMHPTNPKREISEKFYNTFGDGNSTLTLKENNFNTELGLLSTVSSIAIGLIILGLYGKKKRYD